MKTLVTILTGISLLFLTSCEQNTDINSMMNNQEMRTKMMDGIVGNHEYMTEFMTKMKTNKHAMEMMKGNKDMMGMMMKGGDMQMMKMGMMKDEKMMHGMMQNMMKDGKMMQNMMQMMKDKGMMNEEYMQSCMKMMNDKGMDMKGMDDKSDMNSKEEHNHNH